jgi:lysophospholipase L1-like esterase
MEWTAEQVSWLVKVFQPERSVASLPGGRAGLAQGTCAALLGLADDVYATAHAGLVNGAKEAARELLADTAICAMVDRLPVKKGGRVVAVGDSHTSDPQSWAVILGEMLSLRRPGDAISVVAAGVGGETSTHALIRIGDVIALEPDWILFLIGVNDARTQGPVPTKTIVEHHETARNLAELQRRASRETTARCLWMTPPPVIESRVAKHWALARFGVRFRNEDIARVADAIRKLDAPHVDLFSAFGEAPPADLVTEDGLHFLRDGQKRIAREIVQGWSRLG